MSCRMGTSQFVHQEKFTKQRLLKMTAVDFFLELCLQDFLFFSLLVLIRFITMLILNVWVTITILRYRKTKKTD